MMGAEWVLLVILGLPAVYAFFARDTSDVLAAVCLPGAILGYSLWRLGEITNQPGDCGLGGGIVGFIAVASGLSFAAALMAAVLPRTFLSLCRRRGGLEFFHEVPRTGLTPAE